MKYVPEETYSCLFKKYTEFSNIDHPAFTYSKLTIETQEQGMKYVQS